MDEKFFFDAMSAVGLRTIIIDEDTFVAPVHNALYTVRSGDSFLVTKFSPDLEPLEVYTTSDVACSCPAGHRDDCRHRSILKAFQLAGRIDSGWFVNWDKGEWIEPINQGE